MRLCRVFLCDDDSGYRALVRAVLEPEGAEIVGEASNGSDCVVRAAATDPDVILLDEKMPGGTGLESLPRIRAAAPGAAVVFLTTAASETLRERALAAGARAFLRKPTNILELPRALRSVLA